MGGRQGRVVHGTGRRTRHVLSRTGTGVRGAVHRVGRTRTRGRRAGLTHGTLRRFGTSIVTTRRRSNGVTHGVTGLRRHGRHGGRGRGTPTSGRIFGHSIVRTNSGIHLGKRISTKAIVRIRKGRTIMTFNVVGDAIGLRRLRGIDGKRVGGRVRGDAFIDIRATSSVRRGGLGFGRRVSIENVEKSRTLRTIACFISSTVRINTTHVHVLRKAKANVLQRLVHSCLRAIPNIHRCRSRRIRFKNTNVAIMRLRWRRASVEQERCMRPRGHGRVSGQRLTSQCFCTNRRSAIAQVDLARCGASALRAQRVGAGRASFGGFISKGDVG